MSDEERFNFTNELLHALAELLGACRAVGMGPAGYQRILDQIRALTPSGRRDEVEFPGR